MPGHEPSPPDRIEQIRAQLERLLNSHQFRGSRRCQNLLRHITEQALAGDTLSLKERTLGIGVFGRQADYDTSEDPVVRATAAEIRKKLAQYYQDPQHQSEPRIEVLPGSYIPEFHLNGAAVASPKSRFGYTIIVAGIAAVLLAGALGLALPRWKGTDLDRLWGPMLKAPGTVLICMGQPITYNLKSAQAQDAIQSVLAPDARPETPKSVAITEKDLVILADRYVALGDAICLLHVTSLFDRYGKPYRIRGERSTNFADLRENPAVLIAAFDNQWTLRTAGQLRFTFVKDSAHDTDLVRDAQNPSNTKWALTGAWPNWDVSTDYAIVSRVLDTTTDRPVIIAAGITQYGTMAAGEFLTDARYFSEAVPLLPRDWPKKNLQIVLRVPVVNRTPGRPRILAWHVW